MSTFSVQDDEGPKFQFTSLDQSYRRDIILLSGDANLPGFARVTANAFELSALGAFADLLGEWDYPDPAPRGDPAISLASWRHIAVTGRDIYVRVTTKGYLFPLGHKAVLVSVVERVIVADPVRSNFADAYLQIQEYIRVLQPVKSYPAPGQPFGTNDWPFSSVAILTSVSPLLDQPNGSGAPQDNPPVGPVTNAGGIYPQVFLPTSGGAPVLWDLVATDLAGHELHLRLPLCFFAAANGGTSVDEFDADKAKAYVTAYNNLSANRQASAGGAPLRFAPEAGGPAGGTTHPVVSITLGAATTVLDPNAPPSFTYPSPMSQSQLGSAGQPAFYPVLSDIQARLSAADALSGGSFSDSSGDGVVLQYYPNYVVGGLPAGHPPSSNKGAVYAQFKDAILSGNAPLLRFPANLVGGLGNPNGHMLGLSAIAGPVAGDSSSAANAQSSLDKYAGSGASPPSEYFAPLTGQAQAALSQFLGGLPLAGIIKQFGVDMPGGAPNITSNLDPSTGVLTVTYMMTADLTPFPSSGPVTNIFVPNPGGNQQLTLTATATVAPDGTTTYDVNGSIDPFTINLFGDSGDTYLVLVPFNSLTFSAQNGQKPQVQVAIGGVPGPDNTVTFEGYLSFVNALQQFLADMGGSGLSIAVTGDELDATFSLGLPSVGLGMFSLSGISLTAGLTIPFLGGPAVALFGFASSENPFTLTVAMFGGGGFFLLGLGFGGIQQVQAQFQFEGSFQLDLVVASGGITLAAGIYYSYNAPTAPNTAGVTTISGFVRLTGELSVLGLISISAELDLVLTYQSPNSVEGTASLTVTINLCFFSLSPSITVHKQFSGGGGDPPGPDAVELDRLELDGDGADLPKPTKPAKPVKPILFVDIVPDAATWDNYIGAFGA